MAKPGSRRDAEVQHGGQVELALVGGDLGQVAAPALIDRARRVKSRLTRSGIGAAALSGRVRQRRLRFGDRPAQTLAGHRRGHRVDRHLPAGLDEVLEHPRRPVGARRATRVVERRLHRRVELGPALLAGGRFTVVPLVEPRLADTPATGSTSRGAPDARSSGQAMNDATLIASPP